jgi:anti-anti-sigma factor
MDSIVKVEVAGKTVNITLEGKLDAVKAPELMDEFKKLIGTEIEKIVFYTSELEYISSAGLRTIIFAKQKIGMEAEVFFVGAQEAVLEVIQMSGLDNFLTITDKM